MSISRPSRPRCRLGLWQRVAVGLLLAAPLALTAQSSGGSYAMPRQLIASGGARISSGSTSLTGSIGQSTAAVATGGSYELSGGFHVRVSSPLPDALFRNGFEN